MIDIKTLRRVARSAQDPEQQFRVSARWLHEVLHELEALRHPSPPDLDADPFLTVTA